MKFLFAFTLLVLIACFVLLLLHINDLATCSERGGVVKYEWVWVPMLVGKVTTMQLQHQGRCVGATR